MKPPGADVMELGVLPGVLVPARQAAEDVFLLSRIPLENVAKIIFPQSSSIGPRFWFILTILSLSILLSLQSPQPCSENCCAFSLQRGRQIKEWEASVMEISLVRTQTRTRVRTHASRAVCELRRQHQMQTPHPTSLCSPQCRLIGDLETRRLGLLINMAVCVEHSDVFSLWEGRAG